MISEASMADLLIPDRLWERISPLLDEGEVAPQVGRPRIPDRDVLRGILFVLRTECAWEAIPKELKSGSSMTCWRRLQEWQQTGVWKKILRILDDDFEETDSVNLSRKGGVARALRNTNPRQNRGRKSRLRRSTLGR